MERPLVGLNFLIASLLSLSTGCGQPNEAQHFMGSETALQSQEFEPVQQTDFDSFSRLAGTFVASKLTPSGSRVFFTEPKPYGSWLCRVDRVHLPEWIVKGRKKTKKEFWQDDISIEREYAAWRSPSAESPKTREQACREFDRFERLISVFEGVHAPRYVFILDQLLQALKQPEIDVKVKFNGPDNCGSQEIAVCTLEQALEEITVFTPFSAATTSEEEVADGKIYRDDLNFRLDSEDGHPVILSMKFESLQTFGEQSIAEADIISVSISVEHL